MDILRAMDRQQVALHAIEEPLRAIDIAKETLATCLRAVARERTETGALSAASSDRLQSNAWALLNCFDEFTDLYGHYHETSVECLQALHAMAAQVAEQVNAITGDVGNEDIVDTEDDV